MFVGRLLFSRDLIRRLRDCGRRAPRGHEDVRGVNWSLMNALVNAVLQCTRFAIVMLRYIENIEISVRYRYIVSPAEIPKFSIYHYSIDFLIYHLLAEFLRVVSRSREIFIETFIETLTEFFVVRKFREILH